MLSGKLIGGGGDPLWDDVVILLKFEGDNLDTTTVDSSIYQHPMEITGNASGECYISTTTSKFGGSSCFVNNANDPDANSNYNPPYRFQTTNSEPELSGYYQAEFTLEGWFFFDANYFPLPVTYGHQNYFAACEYIRLYHTSARNFTATRQVGSQIVTWTGSGQTLTTLSYANGSSTYNYNEWNHLAMCRDMTDEKIYLYLNGVKVKEAAYPNTYYVGTNTWENDAQFSASSRDGVNGSGMWSSYIDEIRYTKALRYPGGITFDPTTGTPLSPVGPGGYPTFK